MEDDLVGPGSVPLNTTSNDTTWASTQRGNMHTAQDCSKWCQIVETETELCCSKGAPPDDDDDDDATGHPAITLETDTLECVSELFT